MKRKFILIFLLLIVSTIMALNHTGINNLVNKEKINSNYYGVTELTEYNDCKEVPLLMQYDRRWRDEYYAGDKMKNSGCGPTCLSMVSIYLLKNTKITPLYVARFAEEKNYSIYGNGSKWTLISEGGNELGLNIKELPLDKNIIIKHLKNKNPIICIMGPGDFTSTGHFIVMTEHTENGKIKINDPNSKRNSEKLWNYDDIYMQIRNLWVCTV